MINTKIRDLSIINHINNYCDEIKNIHTQFENSKEQFNNNSAYEKSIAFCVFQIGELTTHLSDEYKLLHKEIDWKAIRGVRNIVAHHYGDIDAETLWDISTNDIKDLKDFCKNEIFLFTENKIELTNTHTKNSFIQKSCSKEGQKHKDMTKNQDFEI